MKKSVHNSSSKLKPSNFVRRVLSRTSTSNSKASLETDETEEKLMESNEKSSVNLESELNLLKKQIDSLQITVQSMHNETDRKDKALVTLAKEKEQLAIDLKKQKRSNVNLKQQLEDERNFYYKEKEQYCNEMNNCKKIRQKSERVIKEREEGIQDPTIENAYKKEIFDIKNTLNQTLEANYNLSVKFLRMKNTKLNLKNQLAKLQQVHDKAMQDYRLKLEDIQKELDQLVSQQMIKPIPPSNKKYLQIVKQNGCLIHENLCLQLEVDRLNLELERMKLNEVRNDTNNKLKYIHHTNKGPSECPKCKSRKDSNSKSEGREVNAEKESDSVRTNITSTTADTLVKNSSKKSSTRSVHKIYENINEDETSSMTMACSEAEIKHKKRSKEMTSKERRYYEEQKKSFKKEKETKMKEKEVSRANSKYELMTVSNSDTSVMNNNESETTFYTTVKYCQNDTYRTQSAPEIVRSSKSLE